MYALSPEDIRIVAPAVYGNKAQHLSEQYKFQSTSAIIDIMTKNGWAVTGAAQQRSVRRDPQSQFHRVLFAPNNFTKENGVAPQILLLNSHNGRSKIRLKAGLFRFACANGLVIGEDAFNLQLSHRHYHEELEAWLENTTAQLPAIHEKIDNWKKIDVSKSAQTMATAAVQLRFGKGWKDYEPRDLLETVRDEDEGMTLWPVYNRIQEGLIEKPIKKIQGRGTARPIKQLEKAIELNQWIWKLAKITEQVSSSPVLQKTFQKEVEEENFLCGKRVDEIVEDLAFV